MSDNLWTMVRDALERRPDQIAWVQRRAKGERHTTTYRQVKLFAENLSDHLARLGVVSGDRVGVLAANGPAWASAAFAVWRVGASVAPLHLGNSDEELRTQAAALAPRVILYQDSDRGLDNAEPIRLSDAEAPASDPPDIDRHAEAASVYTSGSTGSPKIVRLSHHNIMSNVLAATRLDIAISHRDRFLSLLPLSHAMEMTGGMLLPLYSGATIVVPRVLAANEILAAMEEENITLMIGVPRLYRNIMLNMQKKFAEGGALLRSYVRLLRKLPMPLRRRVNRPIRKHFGTDMKCWLSGGSRLDPMIGRFFRDLGLPLIQGYGLTECSPVVSVQSLHDPLVESVGKPLEGVRVRVESTQESDAGELWVQGPNVMLGYTDPEATAACLVDGWYRTGDIARLVDGGKIVLTGRSKRLIVTEAGKNVYPEDLEMALERHSDLKEAGVFELDMRPAAVLAIDPPAVEDKAREIVAQFNARVSPHNRIARYAIVDELPRTPLGKVAIVELPGIFAANES